MAEKRKSLSKRIRFEVFKRDKFTCQYCGKSAPDVVLEVDHVKPVSRGGTNDIFNLVTSCFECNRGKTNIELSDETAVKKQQKQIQELSEKEEQLRMILEWRNNLKVIDNQYVDAVALLFSENTDWNVSEFGKKKIHKWIKEFSLNDVLEAAEISIERYYDGTEESWNVAFNKVSGICYTKRKQSDDKRFYYCNYTIKAICSNNWYCDKEKVRSFIFKNVLDDKDFERVRKCLQKARNWSDFRSKMEKEFNDEFFWR